MNLMPEAGYQLQVQTVFTAADPLPASPRLRALAITTLIVGLIWLFVTWYRLYPWIERTLVLGELNVSSAVMNRAAGAKGQPANPFAPLMPPPAAAPARGGDAASTNAAAAVDTEARRMREAIEQAQLVLGGCAFGWLALASLTGLSLVVAGASGWRAGKWSSGRPAAVVITGLAAIGLIAWYVWAKYQWYQTIIPGWVKPSLCVLAAVVACAFGALLGRHAQGLLRGSGIMVVISAAASVAAIWAAVAWGEMPATNINRMLYLKVFAIQSAYGWILLAATLRS